MTIITLTTDFGLKDGNEGCDEGGGSSVCSPGSIRRYQPPGCTPKRAGSGIILQPHGGVMRRVDIILPPFVPPRKAGEARPAK